MDSLTTRFQNEVYLPYVELLRSQYRFHPTFGTFERQWTANLTPERLVKGPYLERSQFYKKGVPLKGLGLNPRTEATIADRLKGRPLYKHQTDALQLILKGKNAVIATGTSSGKTLCFQIPILDDLLRDPRPGLRAIIIYPLNALVNDQLFDWEKLLASHREITFARFTGQTPVNQVDYEENLRQSFQAQFRDQEQDERDRERMVQRALADRLRRDRETPNHLRHRLLIRQQPPHILITNFSMLEYLLVRPVDAPIFGDARLRFIVLDEAHAYRGVQATEIGFLVRRLKDRLGVDKALCIATSATLGEKGRPDSEEKVRNFAAHLFDEEFPPPNPIYGETEPPSLLEPSFTPQPEQYREAVERMRREPTDKTAAHRVLSPNLARKSLREILLHDSNLMRLRSEALSTRPMSLSDAANVLWPGNTSAEEGMQALLEIVAWAAVARETDDPFSDDDPLLPTRLHYFVRAQDGLHVCLRTDCPGRSNYSGSAVAFPSRKNDDTPEGECPSCFKAGRLSKLVELVTCRRCGYLYGALQDLAPRRKRSQRDTQETTQPEPRFDSFSAELGWAADSFWSYFSVADELPYPARPKDEESDDDNLILNPAPLEWCAACGKRIAATDGDVCQCEEAHKRDILIFHRQCPADDLFNLESEEKRLLLVCPNCGARNGSGLEPLRRFQESEDETGTAAAIPLAHFDVSPWLPKQRSKIRKLLCFTDHRQRAAAFPSLLEEETFAHDVGREIMDVLRSEGSMTIEQLGERLADIDKDNREFFLPVSRLPDESERRSTDREKANLWKAETLSYFAIPDAARESVEDMGLVAVRYRMDPGNLDGFTQMMAEYGLASGDADAALQTLLGFVRQHKAFTMPDGVRPDAVAFGRVRADIFYQLKRDKQGSNVRGWLPARRRAGGGYYDNAITDYLCRVLKKNQDETLLVAERIWQFLADRALMKQERRGYQLFSDLFLIEPVSLRYVCSRCGHVTAYSARACCPRKGCDGQLEQAPLSLDTAGIITRWAGGHRSVNFRTLNSEEHTAQINKTVAAQIEEGFRDAGINLLSSTTTFEMGINIGDLQKILLRNVPPTSSNYVQRVGRAGRGGDKNSVCVTLCRGTKYDLDLWNEPQRIMSGVVRPPAVFLENRIIGQRHFNAVAFARFLRDLDSQGLMGSRSQEKQEIRLAGFLPAEARRGIPADWLRLRSPDEYFDFSERLRAFPVSVLLATTKGERIVELLGGIEKAKTASVADRNNGYDAIMRGVAEELKALVEERQQLQREGRDREAAAVGESIRKLLDADIVATLARRGFLPRYAFPLDVVTLETRRTRWDESDVELSRDRAIAISEFAPGAQVIARKKVYTSAGLYIGGKSGSPDREWYCVCPSCGQIRTAGGKGQLPSECPACRRQIPENRRRKFVQPTAFSISFEETGPSKFKKSSLIRQRQSLTHFIDTLEEAEFGGSGKFRIALKTNGLLFRYNLGPENRGFALCPKCGFSISMRRYRGGRHRPLRRVRQDSGEDSCGAQATYTEVAYGHTFRSHCLIMRPDGVVPSVESMAYALQKGACQFLELETSDIGVAWRFEGDRNAGLPVKAEIILYDRAPGGAGFVQEAFDNWNAVVTQTRAICSRCSCPEDKPACYDCLKDYGNQNWHERLDRFSVLRFLGEGA